MYGSTFTSGGVFERWRLRRSRCPLRHRKDICTHIALCITWLEERFKSAKAADKGQLSAAKQAQFLSVAQ